MIKKIISFFLIGVWLPLSATVVTFEDPIETPPQENLVSDSPIQYQATLGKSVLLILIGLAFVFLLMLLFKRFSMIRYAQLNQNSHIKIIERRPISTKSTLYLIQIGSQKVLIAESQIEIKKVADLS